MCALAGGSSSGTSPGDVHATKNEPEGKLRLGIENRELNGAGALTSPGYGPTLSKRRVVTSACDLDSIVMSGAWLKLERRAAIGRFGSSASCSAAVRDADMGALQRHIVGTRSGQIAERYGMPACASSLPAMSGCEGCWWPRISGAR